MNPSLSRTSNYNSSNNRRKLCDVYTNTEEYVCEKCAEREKFDYMESDEFRASYLKSINYINCCHSLINELLHRKTGNSTITLPDLPNFMDVLAAAQIGGSIKKECGSVLVEQKERKETDGNSSNLGTDGRMMDDCYKQTEG